jgi:N-acetylglucosaminyldiphosphoundecaprenol N-acetyl-beta-D-mannosaminyltransferase
MKQEQMHTSAIFGVRIDATGNALSAAAAVADAAFARQSGAVCVANVDMLTRAVRDPALRQVMRNARLVVTDGMPLVWVLRSLMGMPWAQRVYGPQLMHDVCLLAAQRGLKVFLYGGSAQELSALQQRLSADMPELQIVGAVSPPMLPDRPPRDPDIESRIRDSGAHVVFVGLGCPKQEFWMAQHAAHLPAVCLGVGLAFAQLAGLKARAPAWMQQSGLEWLFRLAQEPRRLWRRYLVGNSLFIWYLLRQMTGGFAKR